MGGVAHARCCAGCNKERAAEGRCGAREMPAPAAGTGPYRAPPPPRTSRSLMLRAVAYKLQERELGGLIAEGLPMPGEKLVEPKEGKAGGRDGIACFRFVSLSSVTRAACSVSSRSSEAGIG
jgi:hypothetical protein